MDFLELHRTLHSNSWIILYPLFSLGSYLQEHAMPTQAKHTHTAGEGYTGLTLCKARLLSLTEELN